MERTRRLLPLAALGLAASLLGPLGSPAGSAMAQADSATRVLDVGLEDPAVVGREIGLRLDAVNPAAPVNGMLARFAGERGGFGTSACQVQDARSGALAAPFAPGSVVRLAIPHRFATAGRHAVTLRVDTGGCLAALPSVFQPLTVIATPPGQPPVPPLIDPPTPVPVPGVDLPAPGVAPAPPVALPPLPVAPPPPPPVGLPSPPVGLPSPVALSSARARPCPFSRRRVGSSRRGSRRARIAVRCELNKIRRRYLRPSLRSNGRLWRAAGRHSQSMVARRFFSHVAPGGVGLADRIQRTGYLAGATRWSVGENLGYASGSSNTPRSMVDAWMRSTPHRANVLARKFREIGLGVVPGVPGHPRRGATFATVFGLRR